MSKKHSHKRDYDECCGCEPMPCCGTGNIFGGMNSCITPIIFLLIACGSGLLNNNCSVLIILLFLLCGGCLGSLFGGDGYCC